MPNYSKNTTYPEIYFSDEIKHILSAKPEIPAPPQEPEKPTVVADPGEYNSGGNRGCFLVAFICSIIAFFAVMSSDNENKGGVILPGLGLIACTFFLFKTTTWDKEINERQREEHKKSLSTLPERKAKYENDYSNYLKEMDKYNEEVRFLNSSEYISNMRIRKLKDWLDDRYIPDYEDYEEDDNVKKGASELFFYNELQNLFHRKMEIYNDKKVPTYDAFYYPDILLIYKNLYIDIEIDEPYAGNDGTPIHYISKDEYDIFENIDKKRNDFMTGNGFEVIRFSEEQIFLHTEECIKFIIDFIKGILSANLEINCDDYFLVQKWTKEEASKMAYKRFRNTYVPTKYKYLINKEDHRSYEEMRKDFED